MKRLMGSWHHYEMTHPPFLTSKEAFCTSIVGEVSLSSRMRSMQSFIFYQWTTQPPPLSCFHGILALWSFCPQATNCSPWGPSISCLKSTKPIYFEGIPKGTLAKFMFWNYCRWGKSGNSGNSVRLYLFLWGSPKSLQMVTEAIKLKDTYSLEEKLWPT